MKIDYTDMTPVEIRVAIVRARTTQAAIARAAAAGGQSCSRAMVCRVIDGNVVSDRVRRAIAEAIRIPVEHIWRSYYLARRQAAAGRVVENNQSASPGC